MQGRRRWVFWGVGAYVAILVAVAAGLWLLYGAARQRLDEALGQRLLAVATTAAHLVDGDELENWALDPEPSLDLLWLRSRLEQIRRENDLAEITLCDPTGFTVISATGRLDRGEVNVFWELDRPAVELAVEGFPAATRLYRSRQLYQKSAHAPVRDARGAVVGVLTVEGDADFFDALASLRGGALATGLTVLALLAVLGLLIHRTSRALERYRAASMRQENLAAMGRMTAGIAHEIRNPLGIIRGAGQHLARVLEQHGVRDETATFIPEEVDRLDRILTGYLAFGTDNASEPEPIELGPLVRRTLRLLDDDAVDVVEPLPAAPLEGDPRRLQQVLLNLLLNARDAMPEGGRITVALTAGRDQYRLTISDEGPGLPAGDPDRLFDPFWTTKDKGSGLGLAVSRRIARQHGGDLRLGDRADGRGATATLTLPAAHAKG